MAFDIGAGLSEMGKTVAQTTSVAMLEQMKSQNEVERIKLANELATERESRGRKEAHGYDMEKQTNQQGFLAGQNDEDRKNRITTTGMSVGGQLASTRMSIEARKEEAALDRKLREREIDDRWIQTQQTNTRQAEEATALNEYRRDSLKAQMAGHGAIKIDDETRAAVLVNTATGETKPLLDLNGKPLKISDPEAFKALNTALGDESKNLESLNRWLHESMVAANVEVKAAAGSFDNNRIKQAQAQVDKINEEYKNQKLKIEQKKNAYIDRLLGRVQVDVPGAATSSGPRPITSIITGPVDPGKAF